MNDIESYAASIIKKGYSSEGLIIYNYKDNYKIDLADDKVFDVRSISKTVLALACGILISNKDNDFTLETKVYPIIKDKVILTNKENLSKLEQVEVRHLLSHNSGFDNLRLYSTQLKEDDYDNLLNYCINYPLTYKPGSYFYYTNAGYYILSAVMQEYLGVDLFNFINTNLLIPLGIKDRRWGRYGKYLAGATKINLNAYDMLKIGKLIANKGKYEGKEIVSSAYIEQMISTKQKDGHHTNRTYISEDNYGYGIWISNENTIFASGTGGQLIALPLDLDFIIISTNSGEDKKGSQIKNDIDQLIKYIYKFRS